MVGLGPQYSGTDSFFGSRSWSGFVAGMQCIFHDRPIVLIAFNNDVADSWQWADDPRYPAERINLGLRRDRSKIT